MKVKHLDHLNLTVENFNQTVDWYRRVFGFELVETGIDGGEPRRVLRSGEALLCIYQKPGFTTPSPDETRTKKSTPSTILACASPMRRHGRKP